MLLQCIVCDHILEAVFTNVQDATCGVREIMQQPGPSHSLRTPPRGGEGPGQPQPAPPPPAAAIVCPLSSSLIGTKLPTITEYEDAVTGRRSTPEEKPTAQWDGWGEAVASREIGGLEVGGVGGRDVLERGGLVGWDPPPPRVPLWSPPKAGQTFLSVNPLGIEGAEAKIWLSASNIGRGGGCTLSYGVRPF